MGKLSALRQSAKGHERFSKGMERLRLKHGQRKSKAPVTPPEPRYDDVFFKGVEWLDSL